MLGWAQRFGLSRLLRLFTAPPRSVRVRTLGLEFESPFGLAAGFDKNARVFRILWGLGFGHIEVGTVTARAQPGNPRPRLFRLLADRALINRMGFNNDGAAIVAPRLRGRSGPVVGVNIGKNLATDVADSLGDYLTSTRLLAPHADYLVVNVSSPNTPGLRGLQEIDKLEPLLSAVKSEAGSTPVLVKIAPDLTDKGVDAIADLVLRIGLDGIIATNTTLSRVGLLTPSEEVEAMGAGGLSGPPVARRSSAVVRRLRSRVGRELCIIAAGGVETAQDVRDRLADGATLVQGYTAFLYEGPLWAARITRELSRGL
ncbi:MAG: quinone-dependent dihydroorotate dehydrogenase, partial [Microbacteriaceae bacterium]|nr:quinone-dependent dihydroorotate dehydrogenase [Microbacteriaceae bacterium]